MVAYLQRIVGYTLTGQCTEQCLFFLHGPGANGKSVFVAVLQALLGDYAASTRTETLMVNNNTGGANNDVARLRGARVVTATETEAGQRWAESRIKQITGGDRISARFLYGEYFEYLPQFKLFVAGNHKPRIGGDDEAIWRRLKVLPFTVIIPEDERDPELTQRLLAELPGILNWAIEGCLLWQKNGLMTPKTVRQSTQLYREDQDVFRQWFADCCELRLDDPKTVASAADLHDSHTDWCKDANEMPLSRRELGFRLSDTGAKRVKRNGRKHYEGILLLDNPRRF
jgi:putative DNA primase/helicase